MKSFDNVNYSGKTFKFAMLIKFYHKSIMPHRSWLFIPFEATSFLNQGVYNILVICDVTAGAWGKKF